MWSNVCLKFRKKEEDSEGEKKVIHWLHVAVEALLDLLLLGVEEHIWNSFLPLINLKHHSMDLKKKKKNGNTCLLTKYAVWLDASEDTPHQLDWRV